jgi:hypothetical protein
MFTRRTRSARRTPWVRSLVVACVAVAALALPAASLGAPGKVLLKDDFQQGFDLTSTWALLSFPPFFIADDGIVTTSTQGLYVRASGTNPTTGRPAFTKVSGGDFDHVKWMADTQHLSSNGFPGFDATPTNEVQCSMWSRGQTFGTAQNPFGAAVTNPNTDLRLASFAMNTIDYETGMVFDVWMTNNAIYPYYERLNLSGTATYDAFSSVFPPVFRVPGDQVKVTVAYNRSAGVVRWLVDDKEVARVSRIGLPSAGATTIIDHGGTPQLAAPRQLNCGMALFTLLDGGLSGGQGLVFLAPPYTFPTSFVGGPNLFGQGAEMHVSRFEVDSVG